MSTNLPSRVRKPSRFGDVIMATSTSTSTQPPIPYRVPLNASLDPKLAHQQASKYKFYLTPTSKTMEREPAEPVVPVSLSTVRSLAQSSSGKFPILDEHEFDADNIHATGIRKMGLAHTVDKQQRQECPRAERQQVNHRHIEADVDLSDVASQSTDDLDDTLEDLGYSIGVSPSQDPRIRRARFDMRRRARAPSTGSGSEDSSSDYSGDSDSEQESAEVEKYLELQSENGIPPNSPSQLRKSPSFVTSDDEVLPFLPSFVGNTEGQRKIRSLASASLRAVLSQPPPQSRTQGPPKDTSKVKKTQSKSKSKKRKTTSEIPMHVKRHYAMLQSMSNVNMSNNQLLACTIGTQYPPLLFTSEQIKMIVDAHAAAVLKGKIPAAHSTPFPLYAPMPALGPTVPQLQTWSDIRSEYREICRELSADISNSNANLHPRTHRSMNQPSITKAGPSTS